MLSVVQYAGIGALMGSAYGALEMMADRSGVVHLKDPEPEEFAFDKNAYTIFGKLHRHRGARGSDTDTFYRAALLRTDDLLRLARVLRSGVPPDHDEVYLATGYADDAKRAVSNLLAALPPEAHLEAVPLGDDLYDLLDVHVENVQKMCDHLPPIQEMVDRARDL